MHGGFLWDFDEARESERERKRQKERDSWVTLKTVPSDFYKWGMDNEDEMRMIYNSFLERMEEPEECCAEESEPMECISEPPKPVKKAVTEIKSHSRKIFVLNED